MRACTLLALHVCASCAAAQQTRHVVYQYTYPHNTQQLVENHYIALDSTDQVVRGWYYGTSDEFDSAREGYLPGFFVADMEQLTIGDDVISFRLRAPPTFFTTPVPLRYRRMAEVPRDALTVWPHGVQASERVYTGTVHARRILLTIDGAERVFTRVAR